MDNANSSVAALVNDAQKGKAHAFKELYNRFSDLMFNISIRMTGDKQETDDIIQESFINAFQNLHQLKDKKLFGAWLRKIVVNTCLRHLKNKLDLDDLPHEYETEEENSDWISVYDHSAIHHAIKKLPVGCRQVFLLYVTEDYPHKKIAALLGISESTSKSQYARAKKLLKEQLVKNNG